jgi:hypothetical protein
MHSADSPASRPLALLSQLARYPEWLKVALRLVLTHPGPQTHGRRYASTLHGFWRNGAGLPRDGSFN